MKQVPALRILLPFVVGILLCGDGGSWWVVGTLVALAVTAYIVLMLRSRTALARLNIRPYFIIPICLIALALGYAAAQLNQPPTLDLEACNDKLLTARVDEISYTDRSMRLLVSTGGHRLQLSTRGCDYSLREGDVIAFRAALSRIANHGNPDETDFATILRRQGVLYTQHLPVNQLEKVGTAPTLLTRCALARRHLQHRIACSRLSPEAQHFVIALILGNDDLIHADTRARFATAGVAHVLALSGLHVGLIAMMVWWLLFPLDWIGAKKWRLWLTLALIVAFAVFTGLSPSVVRATVMIGFVFAQALFYRRNMALNALCVAALLILAVSPASLYAVGFQLSFITVAALLLPGLAFGNRWREVTESKTSKSPQQQFLRSSLSYIWGIVGTSLVAMLATIMLTAYYFHTISLLAFLSNLLILPVLPLFMTLAAVFTLLAAVGTDVPLLDRLLDLIYSYFSKATELVNALPLSHINDVYVGGWAVWLWFAILAMLTLWAFTRRYRYCLCALVGVVLLAGGWMVQQRSTAHRGMVIFNSFASTPLLYFDNGQAWLWEPDATASDVSAFRRYYSGFLSRHGIDSIRAITAGEDVTLPEGFIRPPYAHAMGKSYMAVGAGRWRRAQAVDHFHADRIIVTRRFHGSATKLRELYDFDELVLSGAYYANDI